MHVYMGEKKASVVYIRERSEINESHREYTEKKKC